MKRLLYILFLIFIFLASGELLTRSVLKFDPGEHFTDRTSSHPYIRKDWVPGFHRIYKVGRIGNQAGTVEFKINPFGFRAESMKTALKPQNTQRIFFLGESTTECITLSENDVFPSRVEKLLAESHPDQKFECINAAMSGNLAADSLATLIYKVMYYQPDVIVVMHAINDLRYGTVPTYDPIRRPDYYRSFYYAGFDEGGHSPWHLRGILKKSFFLTLLKRNLMDRFFVVETEKKYDKMRQKRKTLPITSIVESKSVKDFLKNLEEMAFIARGHGVRIILMTEPSIYRENLPPEIDEKLWMGYLPGPGINLSNDFLAREMKRFNDAIRELSRRAKIELIDLEVSFPKDLTCFYDDVHFTPEGSRRAAGIISQYLREH